MAFINEGLMKLKLESFNEGKMNDPQSKQHAYFYLR